MGKTRLNPDLIYKDSSKSINRVDESAYRHGFFYLLKNKDTKARNEVCDKNLLNELDNIKNSTFREKIDKGVVKSIIWRKQKFSMGDLNIFSSINKKMHCIKCKKKTDTKNYH